MMDQSIYPKDCYAAYDSDGNFSIPAGAFLIHQLQENLKGNGEEHPCYGCSIDDCTVRVVKYHDEKNRYVTPPRGSRVSRPPE